MIYIYMYCDLTTWRANHHPGFHFVPQRHSRSCQVGKQQFMPPRRHFCGSGSQVIGWVGTFALEP